MAALRTELVTSCVLCGVAGTEDDRWKSLLALPDPYAVQRCPECGLRWLSPRPDADGYRLLYSDAVYFGGEGASPKRYDGVIADRLDWLRRRLDRAATMLRRDGRLRVLDYGAATGEFVALARAAGHDGEGVELSSDARASARTRLGIELLSAEQAGDLQPSQFDLVHMNHVLEHMPDPLAHLRWCQALLKTDGLLVLEVPQQFDNDLDRMRRALAVGGRQKQFDAYSLHHTYFFTPSSLGKMLRKAGYEPARVTTFNPDKTPLWPPSARNWILRVGLGLADRLHDGGNIIEAFAPLRA
ncbi:MAG TPA: class I SAM-dependent methyltransferase [Gammaproteobacteria bacterium]|nr:class I SAM-dependent methyltransferase [Gammaproteobacteria bacterium]